MSINFTDHVAAEKFIEMAENVAAIKAKLEDLPALRATVEKHEKVYTVGKYAAIPVLTAFHVTIRSVLQKLGL